MLPKWRPDGASSSVHFLPPEKIYTHTPHKTTSFWVRDADSSSKRTSSRTSDFKWKGKTRKSTTLLAYSAEAREIEYRESFVLPHLRTIFAGDCGWSKRPLERSIKSAARDAPAPGSVGLFFLFFFYYYSPVLLSFFFSFFQTSAPKLSLFQTLVFCCFPPKRVRA